MSLSSSKLLIVGTFSQDDTVYPCGNQFLGSLLEQAGYSVRLASRKPGSFAKLIEIVWAAFREDYHTVLIDTFSGRALIYARLVAHLARLRRRKRCFMLHGGDLPTLAKQNPRFLKRLFKDDLIVAPSQYLLNGVCQPLGLIGRVIPNPVDGQSYPARQRRAASPRLFWLRAFHEKYRPLLAIEALAQVRHSFPNATLTMAGPDKDGTLAKCQNLVEHLGLQEAVYFAGLVDKSTLKRLGDEHDIFLNTTSVDNTPVTVVEAMTMGLCIVSTNVGGIPFLVEDGQQGLLVPVDNATAISEAILRILNDPNLASSLSEASLKRAAAFDRETIVATWETTLFQD